MESSRPSGRNILIIAGIIVAAILAFTFFMKDDDSNEELAYEAGNSLSGYLSKSEALKKAKVKMIDVIVDDNENIVVEFTAHNDSVYCRMAVDVPNKSVKGYHVLEWKPAKTDTAESVARRLTSKTGLGCVQVIPMTGWGDAGKIKDDVSP